MADNNGTASTDVAVVERKPTMLMPIAQPAQLIEAHNAMRSLIKSALREGTEPGTGDYGVVPGTDKKALYKPGAEKDTITFQFNPKEYQVKKGAKWERRNTSGARDSSRPQYTGAEPRSLTLELFLDGSDEAGDTAEGSAGDVSTQVELLMSCTAPVPRTIQSGTPLPPFVQFGWGTKVLFTAFVKSVSAKYTLFTPGGMPVRAVCTINLEEVSGEPGGQNPTSGALAARDSHTLTAGDSLQSLAYKAYGNAELWRHIAEANDIDDPMRLKLGSTVLVPALEEVQHG